MKRMKDKIFQVGIILGRITQLCVDKGVVSAGPEMALADFLDVFSEELVSLPLSEGTRTTIVREIQDISATLTTYQANVAITPEDARIMVSLVSWWTDMMLEEFIENSQQGIDTDSSGREVQGSSFSETGKTGRL